MIVPLTLSGFVLFSPWLLRSIKKNASHFDAANTAITLGIFFTFLGISISLYNFNTDNIEQSIPEFLEGLKTAFFSSVVGIGISVALRARPDFFGFSVNEGVSGATMDTLATILEQIDKNQRIGFNKLAKSLTGEEDSSLLTQVQKLRATNADKLDDLNRSFNQFAEKVVADSTQQLIDALSHVINEFNTLLTEQIGDNFQQLNNGVERLVVWQQQHREQVEILTVRFTNLVSEVEEWSNSMKIISDNSSKFNQTARNLDNIIEEITTGVNSFAELGDKAKNSLPVINNNLEAMTTKLQHSVTGILDTLQNQSDLITKNQEKINGHVNQIMESVNENIINQFDVLDQGLTDELEKALNTLGNNLASLSNKFVEDYTPLTEELKRVVEISRSMS